MITQMTNRELQQAVDRYADQLAEDYFGEDDSAFIQIKMKTLDELQEVDSEAYQAFFAEIEQDEAFHRALASGDLSGMLEPRAKAIDKIIKDRYEQAINSLLEEECWT